MSVYIDKKYISLLAPKLSQFKQRGEFLWNFRCPVCGDSHKNKIKARGYIFKRKENFGFMCHNCGSTMNLRKFIKYVDPGLYNEYQLETFVKANTEPQVDVKQFITKPVFKITKVPTDILYSNAVKIDRLAINHPARKYLESRKVPYENLSYTCDFATFVKNVFPNYEIGRAHV